MPELMAGDDQDFPAGAAQSRGLCGGEQAVAEPGRAEAAAAGGEQEIGECPGARVRDGPVRSAAFGPFVEGGQRGGFKRDHPLGGELAERDAQPGPGRAVADDAADLQIQELADPQARAAQHGQADAGEVVVQAGDSVHQGLIDVGRQGPRQRLSELRDVGSEYQPAWRCVGPAPGGDVVEHVAQAQDRGLGDRRGDNAAVPGGGPLPAPRAGAVPGQVALDVVSPELAQ